MMPWTSSAIAGSVVASPSWSCAAVSMILPLAIGALSSSCAPGSTAATLAIMSFVLWPKTAVAAAATMKPAERNAKLETLGKGILQAIIKRAEVGYGPAMQFTTAWHEFRSLRVGTLEDGLTAGHLANRI